MKKILNNTKLCMLIPILICMAVLLFTMYFSSAFVMSDDLFDFTFKLDGAVYRLPCDLEDFTENGWSISSNHITEKTMVQGDTQEPFTMSKGDNKIFVEAYNMSGNAKMLKDCKIGEIKVDDHCQNGFVIAKGIKIKSGMKEVEETFGVPDNREEYFCSFSESICYKNEKNGKYNGVYFLFNSFDNKECTLITLRNILKTDDCK